MKVRFKKMRENAKMPEKKHPADAGFDLTAVERVLDYEHGNIVYFTGIAVEIPEGYCGLVFPRSSNADKDLLLSNSVGVIDSNYRGEITLKFKMTKSIRWGCIDNPLDCELYDVGDRVGQLIIMPYPQIEFEEAAELTETDRGVNGYGSTGK